MIRTIIMNLVSIAIKFTPVNGTVNITSTVKGTMNEISLTDSGVGLTQQELSRIFLPHGTASRPGTNNEQGTGGTFTFTIPVG